MTKPHMELMFDEGGYTCVVMLQPLGYRCGYVGIPRDSAWWGRRVRDLRCIECHGCITYAEDHLPQEKPDGLWWIGFDCMHYLDAPDMQTLRRVYGDELADKVNGVRMHHGLDGLTQVRTLEYCVRECKLIVDQLMGGDESD